MENEQEELEICVHVQATIILGSQVCGRKTPMTKIVQWMSTDSLGRAGWKGKEREFPPCEKIAGTHEALPWDRWQASQELRPRE